MKSLGKWAVIDIETTGIDPANDSVIDLGFLQFEGTTLVKKYSSLVRYQPDHGAELSHFIQKLTGITSSMVKKAPLWREVEPELLELEGHQLIAHNSSFEEKFLKKYFEKNNYQGSSDATVFIDSIFFLGVLNPERSSLNLESFILDFGIAEKELHRGLSDSIDLLKVLLLSTYFSYEEKEKRFFTLSLIEKYKMDDYWFFQFYQLSKQELLSIADQIDFNLRDFEIDRGTKSNNRQNFKQNFSLEFSGKNISAILGEEEMVQKTFPRYKFRSSQEQFASRVGQSFKNNIHSLIQAPTGTGKTLGYLLPAALFAHSEKKQVLIATGTKTLQSQAMEKDVPSVLDLLGLKEDELKVSELIGSGNHLCELMFRSDEGELDFLSSLDHFGQKYAQVFFELVFFHNQTKPQEERIHRGHLAYILKKVIPEIREKEEALKVDYRACTGNNCVYKSNCSYLQGLRFAKEADIVVGNHALMFTWPKSFPRPSYIIVDEAHKIENEATTVFSHEITKTGLESFYRQLVGMQGIGALFYLLSKEESGNQEIIRKIRTEAQSMVEILSEHLNSLSTLMEAYFKKQTRYSAQYWNELPMVKKGGLKDALAISIFNQVESLKFVFGNLTALIAPYMAIYDPKSLSETNDQVAYARFETFLSGLMETSENFEAVLSDKNNYSNVMKFHEDEGYVFLSSPINVGQKVFDGLLNTSSSVVFTSATMANAQGDAGIQGVEWLTGYTYLSTDKRFKSGFFLPPVYDYENKAKVFLVPDFYPFNNYKFVSGALDHLMPLIRDLGGRTLLLFSSRQRFQEATEIILKNFEGKIPVFIQGMGHNLVEEFKKAGGGILLGMESFGEGIDIPGDILELIVIDKIPDLRIEQVIKERREFFEKQFGNEFNDYFQATRARSLHQKLGRLLRTENDKGSVIILDSRVKEWKPNTLNNFIKLMKPYKIELTDFKTACSEAYKFIRG
ncbi:MAG: helicase C-terminal domain-containing protein [Bacteriovoracaceae bacterium]